MTEYIGNDYKEWNGENVILDGGTGTGKTYFCINILGTYAKREHKKILYLTNRSKLTDEIYEAISDAKLDSDTIEVMSYQQVENIINSGGTVQESDYVIADECHYFTSDALFNSYTDISFEFLKKAEKYASVIYISATANKLFLFLERKNRVKARYHYRIENSYEYVDNLYFYNHKELTGIIDKILASESDSKIVVFCNNASRMIDMYYIYKDIACFYCSQYTKNSRLKRICDKNAIKDNTFSRRILFTTIAADNGISFKDKRIKHIFSELSDLDNLVQSLGRKRSLDKADTCNFYIKEYSAQGIQGKINHYNDSVKIGKEYLADRKAFIIKHTGDRELYPKYDIFYQGFISRNEREILMNYMRYNKYNMDLEMYGIMKEHGYKSTVTKILGNNLKEKERDLKAEDRVTVINALKFFENKKLFMEDRQMIRQLLVKAGCKVRYIGINTFNGVLDDRFPEYVPRFRNKSVDGKDYIEKSRVLANGEPASHRNKRYWILSA